MLITLLLLSLVFAPAQAPVSASALKLKAAVVSEFELAR